LRKISNFIQSIISYSPPKVKFFSKTKNFIVVFKNKNVCGRSVGKPGGDPVEKAKAFSTGHPWVYPHGPKGRP
jgi:hypothetical protein